MIGHAPLFDLRECSADASLDVLGDNAHIRVQEEGLQLPVNPLLHLWPVQGCRTDLCLKGPAHRPHYWCATTGCMAHGSQDHSAIVGRCMCTHMHQNSWKAGSLKERVSLRWCAHRSRPVGCAVKYRDLLRSCSADGRKSAGLLAAPRRTAPLMKLCRLHAVQNVMPSGMPCYTSIHAACTLQCCHGTWCVRSAPGAHGG